jgi:hypothetical protein
MKHTVGEDASRPTRHKLRYRQRRLRPAGDHLGRFVGIPLAWGKTLQSVAALL